MLFHKSLDLHIPEVEYLVLCFDPTPSNVAGPGDPAMNRGRTAPSERTCLCVAGKGSEWGMETHNTYVKILIT